MYVYFTCKLSLTRNCSKNLDPVLYFVSAKQEAGYFEHNNLIAVRLPSDLVGQ